MVLWPPDHASDSALSLEDSKAPLPQGIVKMNELPWPGAEPIFKWPPSKTVLSLILNKPIPPAAGSLRSRMAESNP